MKLDDAMLTCLEVNGYTQCGFRRLWSQVLRNSLVTSHSEIIQNTPLAGNKWMEPDINWRFYTPVAKPIVASHAEGVVCQVAASRAVDRYNVAANDDEYNPYKNSASSCSLPFPCNQEGCIY